MKKQQFCAVLAIAVSGMDADSMPLASCGGGSAKGGGGTLEEAAKSAMVAPESDFAVKLNDAGDGAVITKYLGMGSNIIVPATIQGFPVREVKREQRIIGDMTFDSSFLRNSRVVGVTMPEGVTTIGFGAFAGCSRLASITIPDSVKTIESLAFYNCANLVTVTISPIKRKEFYDDAFKGCSKLSLASQATLRAAGLF